MAKKNVIEGFRRLRWLFAIVFAGMGWALRFFSFGFSGDVKLAIWAGAGLLLGLVLHAIILHAIKGFSGEE